jgi:glycerol-3-phosphate dehydrogenase
MPNADFASFLAELQRARPFLPAPLARRLARAYGTRTERLLGSAARLTDLGADLGGGLTEAEVDYLVREEWAQTAEDILWRRSKLGLHAPADTADRVTALLGRVLQQAASSD